MLWPHFCKPYHLAVLLILSKLQLSMCLSGHYRQKSDHFSLLYRLWQFTVLCKLQTHVPGHTLSCSFSLLQALNICTVAFNTCGHLPSQQHDSDIVHAFPLFCLLPVMNTYAAPRNGDTFLPWCVVCHGHHVAENYMNNDKDNANQGLPFIKLYCNASFRNAIQYCHGASIYSSHYIRLVSLVSPSQVIFVLIKWSQNLPAARSSANQAVSVPSAGGLRGREASRGKTGRPGDKQQRWWHL